MNSCTSQSGKRTAASLLLGGRVEVLGLLLALLSGVSYGQGLQARHADPVGSLNSVGEVYVNDTPAPAESTIFSDDRIRTGGSGIATFTMSGMGTLKIAPQSEVRIAASYEFTAELETGTVVLHSIAGPHEMTLRMQNHVLIPSVRDESTTSKIDRAPDGSFLVSCMDGDVGVLTLIGSSGQFLRAGQSVRVFPQAIAPGHHTAASTALGRELPHKKGWTLLGLAGGGAGAMTIELLQGGKHSPSPSAP